jgi:hypothetical protein
LSSAEDCRPRTDHTSPDHAAGKRARVTPKFPGHGG